MGDHTEVVQVKYDNKDMTYPKLLKLFAQNHSMCKSSRQYRSVILTYGDDQKKEATAFIDEIKKKHNVATKVEDLKEYYNAEEYHQKWNKKNGRRF